MATHSRILTREIPWTEEPGGLQSMRSQRVRPQLKQLSMHAEPSLVARVRRGGLSHGPCHCVPSLSCLQPGHRGSCSDHSCILWTLGITASLLTSGAIPFFTFSEWTQVAEMGKEDTEAIPREGPTLPCKHRQLPHPLSLHAPSCLPASLLHPRSRTQMARTHMTLLPDWLSPLFILTEANGHPCCLAIQTPCERVLVSGLWEDLVSFLKHPAPLPASLRSQLMTSLHWENRNDQELPCPLTQVLLLSQDPAPVAVRMESCPAVSLAPLSPASFIRYRWDSHPPLLDKPLRTLPTKYFPVLSPLHRRLLQTGLCGVCSSQVVTSLLSYFHFPPAPKQLWSKPNSVTSSP